MTLLALPHDKARQHPKAYRYANDRCGQASNGVDHGTAKRQEQPRHPVHSKLIPMNKTRNYLQAG